MSVFGRIGDALGSLGSAFVSRAFARERSEREEQVARMERLYTGMQYEARNLAGPWPVLPVGDRTPLRAQKPAVQYDLPELLVKRPTSLLFGEGRAPKITLQTRSGTEADAQAADEVNAWLASIAEEGQLWYRMLLASRACAAGGAVAVTWCVAAGEGDDGGAFEFEHHRSLECKPAFDPKRRGRLIALEKRYQFDKCVERIIGGRTQKVMERWWHRELWDRERHTLFRETPVTENEPAWVIEDEVVHGFGFVPAVWIKLEDGLCTDHNGVSHLRGVEDMVEDVDRVLNQKSRAVFYNQDPERIYFGIPEEKRASFLGGPGQRFLGSKTTGADAAVVEFSGEGQRVAEEHVVAQGKRVLETKRVVSPDPDKLLAAASSGAAMQALNMPMLELVGEWRVPFGQGVRALVEQILRAARSGALGRLGALETPPPAVIPDGRVGLSWGTPFPLTIADHLALAQWAETLERAGLCDRATLVRSLAAKFGWDDPEEILERLEGELSDRSERAQKMAARLGGAPETEDDAESDEKPAPATEPTEGDETEKPDA